MRELIIYLITFIITYLFYVVFVLCRESVLKKFPEGKEMRFLKIKYGINISEKNIKKIANKICLINSFILATTVYIVCLFDNFIFGLVVSIIPLVLLILSCYHLLGTYYSKKGGKHV